MNGGRHLLPQSPAAGVPTNYGYKAGSKVIVRESVRRRYAGRKGAGQRLERDCGLEIESKTEGCCSEGKGE